MVADCVVAMVIRESASAPTSFGILISCSCEGRLEHLFTQCTSGNSLIREWGCGVPDVAQCAIAGSGRQKDSAEEFSDHCLL